MTIDRILELAIKLVLLLTAVVGLLGVTRKSQSGEALVSRFNLGIFEPFVFMAVFFAFMLLFPALGAATAWLGRVQSGDESSAEVVRVASDSLAKSWLVSEGAQYAMVVAATQTFSNSIKDERLVAAARASLASGDSRVALLAAREMFSNDTRDSTLHFVVASLAREGRYVLAARALGDFFSNSERDQAAGALSAILSRQAARSGQLSTQTPEP